MNCVGYSGVAIYTRNSACAPIRAEEGITGILTQPNSSTSFFDLPTDQQIGGYPSLGQLSDCSLDAATLDSEGRCVILEFPAFVLIGTYCPANRDETRDEFRIGFLNALDARVRNLVAAGKKVFLTGDLNIIRDEIDTAHASEQLKKHDISIEQYISTPARRLLNQLLVDGRVIGERDEGRERPVLWDICRAFHPTRKGMFTCWEQKINARPGNFGSRIDYVLCSKEIKGWFSDSNIQEGLMGSDHCPVYAMLKEKVDIGGEEVHIRDIMSDGMFKGGVRHRYWTTKDLLPMSAKLIPEFDRRRSIRDMFSKLPSLPRETSSFSNIITKPSQPGGQSMPTDHSEMAKQDGRTTVVQNQHSSLESLTEDQYGTQSTNAEILNNRSVLTVSSNTSPRKGTKRTLENSSIAMQSQKKGKSSSNAKGISSTKGQPRKGQSSLMGFFKPKLPQNEGMKVNNVVPLIEQSVSTTGPASMAPGPVLSREQSFPDLYDPSLPKTFSTDEENTIIDPIVAKESWSKLLGKRVVPRCEHNEPCISLVTKKAGVNCGRSFYMCPRPIGPSGQKEKNTQWRCGTFIWSSDWTGE